MSDDDKTPPEGGKADDKGGEGFKPIATQEDLNRIIDKRLERERAKYADYEDVKAKASKFDEAQQASLSEIERERQAREAAEAELGKYRTREQVAKWAEEIAKDSGVPASALRGSTREELEEHFNVLSSLIKPAPGGTRTATPPGKPVPLEGEKGRAAAALRALRQG